MKTRASKESRQRAPDSGEQSVEARVYAIIRQVPRGRVVTYGQVAMLADMPRNARQVARLLRFCDPKARVPWYRVLGKHGPRSAHISVPEPEHAQEQRQRLEREGVRFTASDTVRLTEYGWLPSE